jgi:hypothetical protein
MKTTRRENVATVAGHKVWRQRARLLLTPRAVKAQMVKERKVTLTHFDRLLSAHEADVLERWTANEQALSGRAKTHSWDFGKAGLLDSSPLPDRWLKALKRHSEIKKCLDDDALFVLDAFTAIQNRREGARSEAGYGFIINPNAKNKKEAFYLAVKMAVKNIIEKKY